jgi:LuxR family maltose regulon positive regulatory protein
MGGLGFHTPLGQIQLRPPPLRPGVVDRTKLIDRLTAARDARTVTIVAPPGYGKTTLMSLWKEHETRPTGWLTLDRYDNDPAVMHANIVAALQRAGMLSDEPAGELMVPSDLVISQGVPRVANALDSQDANGVLMLDHAETIRSRASNDTIAELAARLPTTVQFVVASRNEVRLPVGLLRAQGSLFELTAFDLAMDVLEAQELLANTGVEVGDDLNELMIQTEGWPAGLYLVASALKAGSSRQSALRIGGNDRFLADYLREEVLDHVSDAHMSFLLRTSILERFCGPLCDSVLGVTDSARTIERLEASNLLIVPLDRTRDWYRYHHLLREFLQAELIRREPDIVAGLHMRAAEWLDAHDLPEEAITHAQAADDGDMVARIVGRIARPTYALGRAKTAFEWLRWFERTGRIARYPEITALGAWASALSGDTVDADRWVDALDSGGELTPSGTLLHALLARRGIGQVRADAQAAQQSAPAGLEWHPAALALEGLADLWDGDVERADSVLARAVSTGTRFSAWAATTAALGARAVIAIGGGDWDEAGLHVSQSRDLIRAHGLERYVTSGLTFAVATRCAAHQGDIEGARRILVNATTIRPLLTTATPGISVQTLLEMARAHLALSDVTGARTVVRQCTDILTERPELGSLPKQHDELKAQLDTTTWGVVGASALTTAELRLLPLLITHLSFPEIGERLYISRHTVKTQAMSIYRKLGASSRSEAVQHATKAGLLTA